MDRIGLADMGYRPVQLVTGRWQAKIEDLVVVCEHVSLKRRCRRADHARVDEDMVGQGRADGRQHRLH